MKVEATGATDYPADLVARIDRVLRWVPGGQLFLMVALGLLFVAGIAFEFLIVIPVWGTDAPFWVEAVGFAPLFLGLVPALAAAFAGKVEDLLTETRAAATAVRYSPAAGGDVTVDLPGED